MILFKKMDLFPSPLDTTVSIMRSNLFELVMSFKTY